MANLLEFSLVAKSNDKKNLIELLKIINYVDYYEEEYKKIGDYEYIFISGESKKSINRDNSLKKGSKQFNLEIEAFEYDEADDGYAWHFRYDNGKKIIEEEIDLRESKNIEYTFEIDDDGEKYNFWNIKFDAAFKLGTNDEKVILKDNLADALVDDDSNHYVIEDNVLIQYAGDSEIIKIPEGVELIDEFAFNIGNKFKKIKKIILPMSLKELPEDGFADFKQLEELDMPNPTIPYNGDNLLGVQYEDYAQPKIMKNEFVICGTALIYYNGNKCIVTIPDGVTTIREYAFDVNDTIEEVIIPNTVNYIDNYAFSNCCKLKKPNISNNVKVKDNYYFNCYDNRNS